MTFQPFSWYFAYVSLKIKLGSCALEGELCVFVKAMKDWDGNKVHEIIEILS